MGKKKNTDKKKNKRQKGDGKNNYKNNDSNITNPGKASTVGKQPADNSLPSLNSPDVQKRNPDTSNPPNWSHNTGTNIENTVAVTQSTVVQHKPVPTVAAGTHSSAPKDQHVHTASNSLQSTEPQGTASEQHSGTLLPVTPKNPIYPEYTQQDIEEFLRDLSTLFGFLENSKSKKKRSLKKKIQENNCLQMFDELKSYISDYFKSTKKGTEKHSIKLNEAKGKHDEPAPDYAGAGSDEDMHNYPKQITDLKAQVQKLEKENQEMKNKKRKAGGKHDEGEDYIKRLKTENRDLSNRLAMEMGKKVSANELAVENVSIKNRPMNIAEEYSMFCSKEWLDAKGTLDEVCGHSLAEHSKMQFLHTVFQIVETGSLKVMEQLKKETDDAFMKLYEPARYMRNYASDEKHTAIRKYGSGRNSVTLAPIRGHVGDSKSPSISKEGCTPPMELTNAVGDFLRNTADKVNYDEMVENASLNLNEEFHHSQFSDLWKDMRDRDSINIFIKEMVAITWKMVLQRPSMKFKYSDKWLGDKCQEIAWDSVKVKNATKVYEVYPMLYHGEQIMAKGKVLLVDTSSVKTVVTAKSDQHNTHF